MGASRALLLAGRARCMRRGPTSTEALLWQQLRGSRLAVGFRRQVVLGPYIVDFCAPAARLVVEVDGGYHGNRARADARRDRELHAAGYTVVHLPAEMVQHHIGEAVAVVRAALAGA